MGTGLAFSNLIKPAASSGLAAPCAIGLRSFLGFGANAVEASRGSGPAPIDTRQ